MKKKSLSSCRLYIITDLKKSDPSIYKKTELAFKGGADVLQLRSKHILDRELLEIGRKLRAIAKKHRKLFIVNDKPHLAKILKADGVHVGQDDLPIRLTRKLVGKKMIIGKSTHSFQQAIEAEKEGADYIGVGPVFKTPTKPFYGKVGLQLVEKVSKKIRIPFVCIGGIDEKNAGKVVKSGAECVAVVRAVFGSKHPERSAGKIREAVLKNRIGRK